jgi:hypothetical protein
MEDMNNEVGFIYHYTSFNGLMGILEQKAFRATHHSWLDDKKEIKQGIKRANKIVYRAYR